MSSPVLYAHLMTFTQQMSFFFPQTDRWTGGDHFPLDHWNNSTLPANNGGRKWTIQNSKYVNREVSPSFLRKPLTAPCHLFLSQLGCLLYYRTSNQDISPRLESRCRIFRLLLSAFHFSYPVNFYVGMSCGVALFSWKDNFNPFSFY